MPLHRAYEYTECAHKAGTGRPYDWRQASHLHLPELVRRGANPFQEALRTPVAYIPHGGLLGSERVEPYRFHSKT